LRRNALVEQPLDQPGDGEIEHGMDGQKNQRGGGLFPVGFKKMGNFEEVVYILNGNEWSANAFQNPTRQHRVQTGRLR
jgi:hypothetical protein